MASDAVQKVLSAEADSVKKNAEAQKQSEDIIVEAERYSVLAVQKKISAAAAESEKIRSEYKKKYDIYVQQAENECVECIRNIKMQAEKNMDNAVNAVIKEFF